MGESGSWPISERPACGREPGGWVLDLRTTGREAERVRYQRGAIACHDLVAEGDFDAAVGLERFDEADIEDAVSGAIRQLEFERRRVVVGAQVVHCHLLVKGVTVHVPRELHPNQAVDGYVDVVRRRCREDHLGRRPRFVPLGGDGHGRWGAGAGRAEDAWKLKIPTNMRKFGSVYKHTVDRKNSMSILYRKYPENIWKIAGKCMEDVWDMFRKISGKCPENVPQSS